MKRKILLIIRGAPATGKSTLASNLAGNLNKKNKVALLTPDVFKWEMTSHNNRTDDDFQLSYSNYEFSLRNYLKAGYFVITEDTWDKAPFVVEKIEAIGKEYAYSIYHFLLKGTCETIKYQNTLRPMIINEDQLSAQYDAIYRKAIDGEVIIDIENKTPEQITKEVLPHIQLQASQSND